MTRIIQGVLNFQRRIFGGQRELFQRLSQGQRPLALFVTCSDSRINPALLSQTGPGELFILRNAGNLVPPHGAGPWAEAATVEYALVQLRVREVIVCGHSQCGAMHGLIEPEALASLPTVAGWLAHARDALAKVPPDLPPEQRLARVTEENVLLQLEHLKGHPAVRAALEARTLRLHGWVYHFEQGRVDAYDPLAGRFVPLEQQFRQRLLANAEPQGPRTPCDTSI